jgi:hypothetical protein
LRKNTGVGANLICREKGAFLQHLQRLGLSIPGTAGISSPNSSGQLIFVDLFFGEKKNVNKSR